MIKALQRNGCPTKAPKNSFGCEHCAMSEMMKMSVSDFNYYLKKDETLHNQKCSGKNCTHGVTGRNWPIEKVCGDQWQAYWCKFASTKLCTTFFCMECGQKRLEKEEHINAKKGRRGRSRC